MYCSLFVYFSAFTRLIDKNGGFHMKPYIDGRGYRNAGC